MREEILNLVKGGSGEVFKASLREACESKIKNHPAITKAIKITQIYEEINELNERVKTLLIEADSLMEESDEPNNQDLDSIKSHGEVEDKETIEEGKMMGSKVFNFDPESIGLQDTNDNVEKMVVKDMKILGGTEAPSSIPLFQDGPEWLNTVQVTGKPEAGDIDITSNSKVDNQTVGKTKSTVGELDRESRTGFDSTNNNVTKVKVMKSFTSDNDIKDWDDDEE